MIPYLCDLQFGNSYFCAKPTIPIFSFNAHRNFSSQIYKISLKKITALGKDFINNLDKNCIILMAEGNSNANGPTQEEFQEQKVTPWTSTAGSATTFDYQRLIKQFGTTPVDEELIEKYERITGEKAHHLIRRNVFFSHR